MPYAVLGDLNGDLFSDALRHIGNVAAEPLAKYNLHSVDDVLNQVLDPLQRLKLQSAELLHEPGKAARSSTHFYGGKGSVLDYVLLSPDFDPNYRWNLAEVIAYSVWDRHLLRPDAEADLEASDHGVVCAEIKVRD